MLTSFSMNDESLFAPKGNLDSIKRGQSLDEVFIAALKMDWMVVLGFQAG
jgi:hypothetical protein